MWPFSNKPPAWHDGFVHVMSRVTKRADLTFAEARTLLVNGDARLFLQFEAKRRPYWSDSTDQFGSFEYHSTAVRWSAPEDLDVFLFYFSGHGNGYVRARAVRGLSGRSSKLACAAALMRVDDWVPQVSRSALKCVAKLAQGDGARHFFTLLEIILTQRVRHRFASRWSSIESVLLAPRWRADREAALVDSSPIVRRFALELTTRADTSAVHALLNGTADSSPLVASWSLNRASQVLSGDELRQVLRGGLKSRLSEVRALALRLYVAAGFQDAGDEAGRALFDHARAVRNVAAFHCEKTFGKSPLPIWRDAFDAGNHPTAMLAALSEHGDLSDSARLRRQLPDPNGRMRALALRGLCRVQVPDAAELLDAALLDSSSHVVRAALELYRSGNDMPARATLERALAAARSPPLLQRLTRAARLLGKWDGLGFLLACLRKSAADDSPSIERELDRWTLDSNRRFSEATAGQRQEISTSLAALEASRPSKLIQRIAFMSR
jgi:HEAT repeat protein